MVFFLKERLNSKFEKLIIGLSSGVMLASAIWSLIIPSLETQDELLGNSLISTALGIIIGIIILFLFDKFIKIENENYNLKRMFNVMTIHNIPEGIVVGITSSLIILQIINNSGTYENIAVTSFFSLAIGIAIQNFPEGLVVSLPFYIGGYTKQKSFLYGFISGIVEPIFAGLTILLSFILKPILPFLLSISAGMMMYVVLFELIPKIFKNDKKSESFGIFGFTIGFIIMMILDYVL